jgi:hypothetical protein
MKDKYANCAAPEADTPELTSNVNPVHDVLLLAEWTAEHMRNPTGEDDTRPEEWTTRWLGCRLVVRKHRSQPGYVWFVNGSNPGGPLPSIAGAKLAAERCAAHNIQRTPWPRGLWTPDRAGQMFSPVDQVVNCVACDAPKAVSSGELFNMWCPHCDPR